MNEEYRALKDHVWETERAMGRLQIRIVKLHEEVGRKEDSLKAEKAVIRSLTYVLDAVSHHVADLELAYFCRDPLSHPSDRLMETYFTKGHK